ncbi:hypothetical protein B0A55_10097 [Friedmanniomyces simplex]|uniref:Uncharacterized protein n=1 Tax=Friedmanniomyces simplex TaxID=329884 RepID=A0A4U0WPW4_9PEZI|nr:hypothetical protein B0A55_10097 [Friedmanniomyces simplex]
MDSAIVRASLMAATLSGISNCLAQCITCYRSNPHIQASADIPTVLTTFVSAVRADFDPVELLRFFIFSLLVCPPNYLWQKWLEGRFPGYVTKDVAGKREEEVGGGDGAVMGKGTGRDGDMTGDGSLKKRAVNGGGGGGEKGEKEAMTEDSTPAKPATAVVEARRRLNVLNTVIKFLLDQSLGAALNTVIFIAGIALLRGSSLDTVQQNVAEGFWPMIRAGQKLWPMVSVAQFTVVPFEWRTLVGSCVGLFWGVIVSLMSTPGVKGKVE